jgi:copper chaperone
MTGPSTPKTAGANCAAMSPPLSPAAASAAESRAPERFDLAIAGMTCGHCVRAVSNALNGLPGVEVDDVRIGRASVRLEPKTVLPAALIEVLARPATRPASRQGRAWQRWHGGQCGGQDGSSQWR